MTQNDSFHDSLSAQIWRLFYHTDALTCKAGQPVMSECATDYQEDLPRALAVAGQSSTSTPEGLRSIGIAKGAKACISPILGHAERASLFPFQGLPSLRRLA